MARKQTPMPVRIVHDEPQSTHRERDRTNMSIRTIENGFLVNEYGYKNGKHFDRDYYTPTRPKVEVPNRPSGGGRSGGDSGRGGRLGKAKL